MKSAEKEKDRRGYSTRFDEALLMASELHRHQFRKGKDVPYITHLLGVASLVGVHGGDEDQVIGALLHDAIEDCVSQVPTIAEDIREKFGPRVLEIVEGCTDAFEDPKPPWETRKVAYMERLKSLPDDSPTLIVSLADKVYNAGAIVSDHRQVGSELWARFNASAEQTLWYYDSLARIFSKKIPGPMADQLERLVEELKRAVEG